MISTASFPQYELSINSPKLGWAEQDPEEWWTCVIEVTKLLLDKCNIDKSKVVSIGIAYQMHGLVALDKNFKVVRPSIIWCDSRAVQTGEEIAEIVTEQACYEKLLNLPGNFTFSKLCWMQKNEANSYSDTCHVMLPGDFIAMKMTGLISTTPSGLSEGTMWDFTTDKSALFLFRAMGIEQDLIPKVKSTFSDQGQ